MPHLMTNIAILSLLESVGSLSEAEKVPKWREKRHFGR
jgi:hypothetical protein